MPDKLTVPVLLIPATPPTFAEYRLIHQTQQQQRPSESTKLPTYNWWLRKLHVWLSLGVLAVVAYLSWDFKSVVRGAILLGVPIAIFYIVGLLYQRWEYWKTFKEQQARLQPESLEFSKAGLRLHYSLGTVFHAWDSLYRVREIGDWLLLYPDMEFCCYLDLKRLPELLTAADVRALIHWRDIQADKAIFAA